MINKNNLDYQYPKYKIDKMNYNNQINNKININFQEYESNKLDNLSNNYKSQLVGFPTLFVTNNNIINKKLEGYDDIINYLNN